MKNSQKGFIVPALIIVVLIAVVAGTHYFYKKSHITNPTENTSDTITYTDSKNGFQIKYPKDLVVTTEPTYVETDGLVLLLPTNKNKTTFSQAFIYTKVIDSQCSEIRFYENKTSSTTINNIPFVYGKGGDAAMGTYGIADIYRTDKNGKCFTVGLAAIYHRVEYSPIDNHMLSMSEIDVVTAENQLAISKYESMLDTVAKTFSFVGQ